MIECTRMMIGFFLAVFVLVSPLTVNADELTDKVDKVFEQWNRTDSPGCAIAVIKNGKIIYKKGYGMADLERSVPINTKSMFDIASTSKQFTAVSILLLEEEGKLSLDDDIRKFFPRLRDYGDKITVRHLIHHTGGLRDYPELMYMAGMPFENDYPEAAILDLIFRQNSVNFKPGEDHLYCNAGYFMLGEIVKRVSGKSLGEFAKEKIFEPLGMTATHFYDDFTRVVKNRAIGYFEKKTGGFGFAVYLIDIVGDGGVLTNVEDLFLWDQNFYNNKLGKGGPALIEKMHEVGMLNSGKKLDYASGLVVSTYKGLRIVSHGGGWAGYRSQFLRFPDQKFSVVCLSNFSSFNPTPLAKKVADIYLSSHYKDTGKKAVAKSKKKKAKFIKLSSKALQAKTGLYRNPKNGRIWEITVKETKLAVNSSSGLSFHMSPVRKDRFEALDAPVDIIVSFLQSPQKGYDLHIEIDGRDPITYVPYQPWHPLPDQLKEYVGNYDCGELGVTYNVYIKDRTLLAGVGFLPEAFTLKPTLKDEFEMDGLIVTFKRDADGHLTGFSLNAGRVRNIDFVKK